MLRRPGLLTDDVELLRPELPTHTQWIEAFSRADNLSVWRKR